jgi:hypothetical protein
VESFVTLNLSSLMNILRAHEMKSILQLGEALTDKSPISGMRDAQALMLFTLDNALKCLDNDRSHAMLYLLPWALQETVLRSPVFYRQERFIMAILSFKIPEHLFNLMALPKSDAVKERWEKKGVLA